jgi:hypothetical protein
MTASRLYHRGHVIPGSDRPLEKMGRGGLAQINASHMCLVPAKHSRQNGPLGRIGTGEPTLIVATTNEIGEVLLRAGMMASRLCHRGHISPAKTDHWEDFGGAIGPS